MAGVDPFAALGIEQTPSVPQAVQAGGGAPPQDTIPTERIQPSGKGGVDPFAALGIDTTQAQSYQPTKPPEAKGAGVASNFAAGANRVIFGALGAPVDFATGAMNLVPRGINAVTGSQIAGMRLDPSGKVLSLSGRTAAGLIPTIQNPVGGSQWLGQQFGKVSVDPNSVQPTNEAERMAQAAGGAVAAVPVMALGGLGAQALGVEGGVSGSVANAIRSSAGETMPAAALTATASGVGGATGQAAEDKAPDWAKPYVSLAGNIAGAGAVTAGARGLQAGGSLITRKAGEMGIGSRQDLNGIKATDAQVNAAGNKLSTAIGPEGQQTIERSLATEKEAQGLEQQLQSANLSPNDRADIEQQLQGIQERRVNLVPGSNPTTAQIAQTPGASDLETAVRVANGPEFQARAQQQNNAQVAQMQGLEPNQGEPASVGQMFANHLQALDQAGQQQIASQAGTVQGLTDAAGGRAPTAQYGGQIREALQAAEAPEHAAASQAFKAIDPEGTWAVSSSPLKAIGKQLSTEVSPTAQTDGQTNALLARAQALPGVIKFSSISQMRADANDALKRLMRTGTAPSEVRRLTIFKQGLDDTIAQSINDRASFDPGIAQRLQGTIEAGQGAAPLIPNVGEAEAQKYYGAVGQWKDLKQKFGQGGVGAVLKENDQGFKVPEGNVPSKIFTGGPTEPGEVERFITAVGGPDNAADIGRNVLANDLRTRGIIDQTGLVAANKFQNWRAQHAPTLSQFPGLDDQFANIQKAQETLDAVTGAHKAAINEFNNSAAAQFIHADPMVAIRRAFGTPNPTETFTNLAQAVRGNPAAENGLKRAVVDYIVQRHSSAVPSVDGIDMLKAAGFRKWVDGNKGPLRALFGGQGMQSLEMVAADLRRKAMGPQAVAGSQTAVHGARALRTGIGQAAHGASLTMLTLLGEHVGEALGAHSLVGAVALPAAGMVVNAMRQAGIHNINDLVTEAMLHPELARTLMEKADTSRAISMITQRRIAKAFQSAIVADSMSNGESRK